MENLTKVFDEVTAVDHLNLTIQDGKLTGLLGPSGCGKSTLLYMISGLEKPTEGRIFFGDKDVTDVEAEDRGIGLVFQNYALYPHMTVEQNICFPLENMGVPRKERVQPQRKWQSFCKLVTCSSASLVSGPAVSSSAWPSPVHW